MLKLLVECVRYFYADLHTLGSRLWNNHSVFRKNFCISVMTATISEVHDRAISVADPEVLMTLRTFYDLRFYGVRVAIQLHHNPFLVKVLLANARRNARLHSLEQNISCGGAINICLHSPHICSISCGGA